MSPTLTRRPIALAALALSAVAALVIADGARRRPANPNAPLVVRNAGQDVDAPGQTLRIATFNIRGGKGRDGVRDLSRIAATLKGVDLAVLQEVHGAPFGAGDQCRDLGGRMGLASLFCPTETRWWGDSFGNGLVSRLPVGGVQLLPLAGTQDRRYRNALLITVPVAGRTVRVLSVHLDDRCDHDAQFAALTSLFLSLERPAVLLGDLNTAPAHPQWKRLAEAEGVTAVIGERWPDRKPLRGVDWIICRGLRCVRCEPRDLGGSDHAALTAELALEDVKTESERSPTLTSDAITETISAAGPRSPR